ncbi:hypothetical protein IKG45_01755 [Candidatus Saccharibacteria bacterium]|nr:hypothetical protein [Candidatus Saccharibacteria bacterium]
MATNKKSTAKKTAARKVAKPAPKKCATRTCKKKEQKSEKHKFIIFALAVVLIILCGSLGAITWARYATTRTGAATTQVAKWAVAVKQGSANISNNFSIPLTANNAHTQVAEDPETHKQKIAPGSTATGDFKIDFTGTEVSTEYSIAFTPPANLPTNAEITMSAKIGNDNQSVACTTSNGITTCTGYLSLDQVTNTPVVDITVLVNWDDHDNYVAGDDDTVYDTPDGEKAASLSLDVTISAKQSFGHNFGS